MFLRISRPRRAPGRGLARQRIRRPRRACLPSGEPCWVVVLDTEGLGGLEADQHYDTRIFSLATLLCSTLVYNSLGSIDEGAISNLSFVANLSQHVRVSDEGDAELDAHEFHKRGAAR